MKSISKRINVYKKKNLPPTTLFFPASDTISPRGVFYDKKIWEGDCHWEGGLDQSVTLVS